LSVRRAHWLEANAKLTFATSEFYLRDSEEITKALAEWPEAVASTLELSKHLVPSSPPLAPCSC
jgi:DNA polymerase III alpha subunit